MKTILQLMDYAAPYEGNFIPSIKNLEDHLKESGDRLIYMLPEEAKNIEWVIKLKDSSKTIYFIERSFFSKKIKTRNIRYLLKVIKDEHVNIIHTHFVAYNYTLALMKMVLIRRVFVIGNFMNEFHPPQNKYKLFKIFITKISFDLIIGSSKDVAKSLLVAGIASKKITIINNALDLKHLNQNDKTSFRSSPDQKVVLMFGWPYYRKGVDNAIEALSRLNAEGGNYILAIALAGTSALIEGEILNKSGNIPSWIKFLSPSNNAAKYYNASDVFLSASREEGLAYSVLEAAFCNCMVVVSAIGGHALDIPFIEAYEVTDIDKLMNAIKKMCNKTEEEKRSIKIVQKEYVARVYDVNTWSKDVIEKYSLFPG